MKKWTPEHDAAFLRWCEHLSYPESARAEALKAFKKQCLTVEEIERDMDRRALIMSKTEKK
jgi:hypothetical protein